MTAFSELGILPEIAKAIEELDWLLPTDVQAEAIPLILGGGDVLMAAETGSGKTGAFCLPIIQIVYETLRDRQAGKGSQRRPAVEVSDKVVLNPYDRGDKFAISGDGLLCQCREHKAWHGARATMGVTEGRCYYETTVTDEGLCRVGWSTSKATHELGKDKLSFGFGGTGKKSYAGQFDDYGEPFGKDDVLGCYIDLDKGTISYSKNGKFLGDAFPIPKNLAGSPFYPAVVLKNAEMKFNFGDSPFKNLPAGYVGVSKASNLVAFSGGVASGGAAKKGSSRKTPMAIIIEPARELAQQTHDNITLFKKHLPPPGISELLLMGGDSARTQMQQLSEGVDIVCGTPGRIDDLISSGKLDLSGIHFFVLDEADGLLSQGNLELIMRVYNKIPKVSQDGKRLQMVVCSATLHNVEVKKLADKVMHFPTWVDLKGMDSVPETVHHVVCYVDPKTDTSWHGLSSSIQTDGVHKKDSTRPGSGSPEMLSEAVKLLKVKYLVQAIDAHKMDQAIIFCRTKLDCDNVEAYLVAQGGGSKAMVNEYSCACLHSDRRPHERKANLQAFKEGEVRFLICTDVAARGIDITGIPYVVNVTLPDDKQNYVHRIGRVGRAERMGLAISLVAKNKEKVWYHKCPSRGKGCFNTKLVEQGGCTIWYNEMEYKNDVETHLGVSIPEVTSTFDVPVNEYDGKITYGEKKSSGPTIAESHVELLSASVDQLASLERKAQTNFIKMKSGGKKWFC